MSRISDSLREQARHLWDDGRHMSLDSDQVECIADELDAWCDSVDVDGNACGEPRELAARIRRLAERESEW